jgi:hypothetical protein
MRIMVHRLIFNVGVTIGVGSIKPSANAFRVISNGVVIEMDANQIDRMFIGVHFITANIV